MPLPLWDKSYQELDDIYEEMEGYEYLEDHRPELIGPLRRAIAAGGSPKDLRRHYLRKAGIHRSDLAQRIYLACCYMKRTMEEPQK